MCPPESVLRQQNGRSSTSTATLTQTTATTQHEQLVELHRNTSEDTLMENAYGEAERVTMIEEVLASAPPPWHSIALIGSVLAIFVQMLPSWDEIDQVATLDTFSKSEAWIGGPLQLGIYRFIIALTIWSTSLYLLCGPGWSLLTSWKPGSKLRSGATIRLQGIKTMFPFTSWSWNMLGLSYSLNALIALSVATGQDVWIAQLQNNWLLRLALIVWEVAAPCVILVSTVIRFAIWEMLLKAGGDTSNLKSFRNVMMHNANAFFVVLEVSLLGGLPVRFNEASLAPLFGVCYVIFTWNMANRWTERKHGPQFIYFFFDTTMGKVTTIALVCLLCALLIFYALFATARIVLDSLSGVFKQANDGDDYSVTELACHASFALLLTSAVCRFRDHW